MSRNAHFMNHLLEGTNCEKKPITKNEKIFKELIEKAQELGAVDEPLDITANGTYEAPEGVRYNPINVSVVAEGDRLKPIIDLTKSMSKRFYNYNGTSVDHLINYSDTENVTNTSNMFYGCNDLMSVPQLDTSNVTNMENMFSNCRNLISLPTLNTNKVNDYGSLFLDCNKLQTIDLTALNFGTDKYAFSNFALRCYSLTKCILRTITGTPIYGSNMFKDCYHFTGTYDKTYNPDSLKDGKIYVPDDRVEELKATTGWSDFADIIVPLSTLEE